MEQKLQSIIYVKYAKVIKNIMLILLIHDSIVEDASIN